MTIEKLQDLGLTEADWKALGPLEKMYMDLSDLLAGITGIRWVEMEYGQLEIPEDSWPVPFPCVLIDFPDTDFSDDSRLNQQGILTVQLRIAIDLYEDLYMVDGADSPDKGKAIKAINLPTLIFQSVHGFETNYSNPLTRIRQTTERRDDGLKVFMQTYTCAVKDDSAAYRQGIYTGAQLSVKKG